MTRLTRGSVLLCLILGVACGGGGLWAGPVHVVGSAALAPFVVAVAERFGYEFSYGTPVVESTGTGGGIKFFCGGSALRYPALVTASRPMSAGEYAYCARHGVHEIIEVPLGLDALVLARAKDGLFFPMSMAQLKQAVARVASPPLLWQEIDPTFPGEPIKIFSPPETAGTRETFELLVLGKKGLSRQDHALRSIADQESVIARKLVQTPDAVGILSYAFLLKNQDTLGAFALNGVLPNRATILKRTYPLVRPVYLYVKTDALAQREEIQAFVHYMASACVQSLLSSYGLMPLSVQEQRAVQTKLSRVMKHAQQQAPVRAALCEGPRHG